MIQTEMITINDIAYKRTYSDNDKYIRKVGTDETYAEAIDTMESAYEYEETDDIVEDESEASEDAEAILALIERGDE